MPAAPLPPARSDQGDDAIPLDVRVETLQAALEAERAKVARLEFVIANTGVGLWDWYVQTGETVFNERWANIVGYALAELEPVSIDTWTRLAHPDDLVESERLLREHWAGESEYYIFETRMRHRDGHWVWVLDTGKVTEWQAPGVPWRMTGTHVDITAQKEAQLQLQAHRDDLVARTERLERAEATLRALSATDPLTSLHNRRAFDERLGRELARASRLGGELALLIVDVDHFKDFNDRYGHPAGDRALVEVAACMAAALPCAGDFIARLGGEEFAVLLPGSGMDDATTVADTLRREVEALRIPHATSTTAAHVTVSIGVCAASGAGVRLDALMEEADSALYRAKRRGRNAVEATAIA